MAKRIADTAAYKERLGGIGSPMAGTSGLSDPLVPSKDSPVADVLQKYGVIAVKGAVDNLKAAGSNATSNLMQSLAFDIQVQGTGYKFTISLADYWQWVNDGRKPTKKKGDKPLWERIAKWITDKGIKVETTNKAGKPKTFRNGKVKTVLECRDDMAKSIAHHIHKNGYTGNQFFSKVVNDKWLKDLQAELQEAFKAQIQLEIQGVFAKRLK